MFASPPIVAALKKLTPDQAVALLKYHAVGDYLLIGALKGQISTLASDSAGKYILKVANDGGKTTLIAGLDSIPINETITNKSPLVIYKVPNVLLPSEIFGKSHPAPSDTSSWK